MPMQAISRGCRALVFALLCAAGLTLACASQDDLLLGAGTTVQDGGLLDVLVERFEAESSLRVRPIAAGTGQLLEMARRGDLDVLLTHDPASEEELLTEGAVINRQLVMHNDFIFVGPADDPAGVGRANDAPAALAAILAAEAPFISRGDDSGTHKLERRIWDQLDFDPNGRSWYEETGQGMGATLQVANQRRAYTIADRGTFFSQRDHLDLALLFEGDPQLVNIYHVMQVNPERHGGVNDEGAASFVAFMVSDATQELIGAFGLDDFGEPLFTPDAAKNEGAPP
jgi:tungstate transport system substrate-binding protein